MALVDREAIPGRDGSPPARATRAPVQRGRYGELVSRMGLVPVIKHRRPYKAHNTEVFRARARAQSWHAAPCARVADRCLAANSEGAHSASTRAPRHPGHGPRIRDFWCEILAPRPSWRCAAPPSPRRRNAAGRAHSTRCSFARHR